MPSRQECEDEIIAAGAGALDRADAKALLRKFADRMNATDDPLAMARQIGDEATAAAIIEKRNRLMNLRNRIARTDRIDARIDQLRTAGRGDQSIAMAVQTEVRAINTVVDQGRLSAEALATRQGAIYHAGLLKDLTKAGLFDSFRDNQTFQRDVGRELYELSMQDVGKEHRVGFTGNTQALDAARVINKWQSLAKFNLNRAGAWIGDYAGYITRTTHDGSKMYKSGFLNWRDFVLTKLDQDRTFEGIENRDVYLKSVYDNLITGIHVTEDGGIGMKDPAFTGPGNLAKRLSQSRELHFADADSWMDYQERFGVGTLPTQIETALTRAGKQQALMERWGTNPRAEYQNDIRRFVEKYRHTDPDAAEYLSKRQRTLMNEFGYLDGTNNVPVNEQLSTFSQGIRNIGSMAHLGFVAFTHLYSMATKIAELRYQGLGFLERWGNTLGSLAQGSTGRGDMKEVYDLLLSGFDGQHTHYMSRFTLDDNVPGMMSNATAAFMKWNGLSYILNAEKAGSRAVMARHLGMQLDRAFEDLQPQTQRAFRQYGISEADWNLLRAAPDHFKLDDRTFLTPDAAYRVPPQEAANGVDLFTQRMRDDLAMKLHTYYGDVADRSIIQPGIAEKNLLFGASAPGTPVGEALRFMMQFKMWAAADVRQGIGREIYGNADFKSRALGLTSLAATATVLGYLRMATTDLLKGATPRDPRSPATIMAALTQGGGMGILGDFMFGNFSRNGQSLGDTILGPTIGTGLQIMEIYNHMKQAAISGDTSFRRGHPMADVGPELLRVTLDNTPFINLFYIRTALNYMFLWRIQEAMNPGFQRRRERRIQHETGQTFWLSPANAVH